MVAVVGLIPLPTCISLLVFKVPCPACGMTRSSLALLTGDLSKSFHYQPILIPLILLCIASVPLAYFLDDKQWKQTVPRMTGAAGVGLLVVWLLRFVGLFGGPIS